MANRQSDFVTEYRQEATTAIKALQALQSLHREAAIMEYPESLGDDAFQGENENMGTQLTSVMQATSSLLELLTPETLRAFYAIRL